jgi:hypothetical protein
MGPHPVGLNFDFPHPHPLGSCDLGVVGSGDMEAGSFKVVALFVPRYKIACAVIGSKL